VLQTFSLINKFSKDFISKFVIGRIIGDHLDLVSYNLASNPTGNFQLSLVLRAREMRKLLVQLIPDCSPLGSITVTKQKDFTDLSCIENKFWNTGTHAPKHHCGAYCVNALMCNEGLVNSNLLT